MAPEMTIFANFHMWLLFLREWKEINNHYKNKSCSAHGDLSLCKILLQSNNRYGSYGPWITNFCIWSLFWRELKEIDNHYKNKKCSAHCSLSLFKILLQSDSLCWSYGPWTDNFCKFSHVVIILGRIKGDKQS